MTSSKLLLSLTLLFHFQLVNADATPKGTYATNGVIDLQALVGEAYGGTNLHTIDVIIDVAVIDGYKPHWVGKYVPELPNTKMPLVACC